jgi:hypothetical protein
MHIVELDDRFAQTVMPCCVWMTDFLIARGLFVGIRGFTSSPTVCVMGGAE